MGKENCSDMKPDWMVAIKEGKRWNEENKCHLKWNTKMEKKKKKKKKQERRGRTRRKKEEKQEE